MAGWLAQSLRDSLLSENVTIADLMTDWACARVCVYLWCLALEPSANKRLGREIVWKWMSPKFKDIVELTYSAFFKPSELAISSLICFSDFLMRNWYHIWFQIEINRLYKKIQNQNERPQKITSAFEIKENLVYVLAASLNNLQRFY